MVYSDLISAKVLSELDGKFLWYARLSDHPKYSFEHEILDIPPSKLIKMPVKCLFHIGREFLITSETTSLACQIMHTDGDEEIVFVKRSEEEFCNLNDNMYLADTQEELIKDIISDLIEWIDHAISQREYSRAKWFFRLLKRFDPTLYNDMYEKSPELFI